MKHTFLPAIGLAMFALVASAQVPDPVPAAEPPVALDAPAPVPAPLLAQAESQPGDGAAVEATEASPEPTADPAATDAPLPLIQFEEAPLNDAIKTLARQAGINFLFDPRLAAAVGPDGQPAAPVIVSVRFENITARQALEAILANHQLEMVQDEKTGTARVTIKDPAAPEPLHTQIIQLEHADPEKLVQLIKPTLGQRSIATVDVRTSQLIVVATESELKAIETLVDTLDIATRQVLIESHLVETSRNPESVKGIDWGGTFAAQNVTWGNNTRVLSPNVSASGNTATTGPGIPITPSGNLASPSDPTALGGGLGRVLADTVNGIHLNPATAFLNADGVSAVISFFNSDRESEVMATPRAVTLDNERATLSVTRAFPIFNITPGSANSPAGAEVKYTNLGTVLEVTPRISANDTVHLKVIPEVSVQDGVDRQIVGGLNNTANIYSIRRMEANVVVPSGNTLVMGGLVSDSVRKDLNKVPLFGDVPYLGNAFRKNGTAKSKSNLLIFVTPTIITDGDFQPTNTDFLQTRKPAAPEDKEHWFDSAKYHSWKKKESGAGSE